MITIVTLTEPGLALAKHIHALYGDSTDVQLRHKPTPFASEVQALFQHKHSLIFICATGIVMRTLAPVIASKLTDPPVLVIDERGDFIIPLLSGHEGGANQWGHELAKQLNAQLVITTALDYVEPVYTLGVGCERHCPESFVNEVIERCLAETDLNHKHIASINSIQLKANESAFLAIADKQQWAFNTYSTEALADYDHLLTQRSEIVYQEVGVYGVAEAAALAGANHITGQVAELVVPKLKNTKATCAVARSYHLRSEQTPTVTRN